MIYKIKRIYGGPENQWFFGVSFSPPSHVSIDVAAIGSNKERFVKFVVNDMQYISIENGDLIGNYTLRGDVGPSPAIGEVENSPLIAKICERKNYGYYSLFVDIDVGKTRNFIFFGDDRYIQILFNGEYELDLGVEFNI